MKVFEILRKKYFWVLLLSLVFCVVAIHQLSYYKNDSRRLSSSQSTIQQKVLDRECALREKVAEIAQKYSGEESERRLSQLSLTSQFDQKGFSFYLFQDSLLTFWSTNRVPIPAFFDSSFYAKPLIQLSNGWYQPIVITKGKTKVLGLALVKYNFLFENSYLENSFAPDFHIDQDVQLSTTENNYRIFDSHKRFLFTLYLDEEKKNTDLIAVELIFLFGIALALLIFAFYSILKRYFSSKTRLSALILIFLALVLGVFRFLLIFYQFPDLLYSSRLFSPIYYASSIWMPSLGDLLLSTLFLLVIILLIKKAVMLHVPKFRIHTSLRLLIGASFLFAQFFSYRFLVLLLKSIVFNSSISFNNDSIFNYTYLHYLVFFIIGGLLVTFVYLSFYLLKISQYYIRSRRAFWLLFTICIVLFTFVNFTFLISFTIIWVYFIVYYLFLALLIHKQIGLGKAMVKVSLLLFFAILITQFLDTFYQAKEQDERLLIAAKLGTQHDPITEYRLGELSSLIMADERVQEYIGSLSKNEAKLLNYLDHTYFNTFASKYKISITVCNEKQVLTIQPDNYQIECEEFFDKKITSVGTPTKIDNIWFMNYSQGQISYLMTVDLQTRNKSNQLKNVKLFIELDSKSYINDTGYPELLIDKKRKGLNNDFSRYTYARYFKNDLVNQFGKFSFSSKLNSYKQYCSDNEYFTIDGYTHLRYRFNENETIIIGKRNLSFFEKSASVSFFFILYGLMLLIVNILILNPVMLTKNKLSFQLRMQLYMVIIIIVSFILIGLVTIFYFMSLNDKKNIEFVNEKTHSILIQFEERLFHQIALTDESISYINQTTVKLAQQYFTDLNVYRPDGQLIASSRPQMVQQGLVLDKMNSDALLDFKLHHKTLYYHDEFIGKQKYWSVYVPFYNSNGALFLYINMPYFAKQKELNTEMSSFVVTFLSIYMLIIFITIIIALLLARYISRPLILIKEKMSNIQLGDKNEKIEWKSTDEIGNLVEEYNKMVDELKLSAELLATSQREQAWREMAQQVAHEIKNPLTPMKLSVQMLERTWRNGDPDWEVRLTQFSKNLVEQIDTLADIASSFSNFAKMPQGNFSSEDLLEVADSVVQLHGTASCTLRVTCDRSLKYTVTVDKNQLIRVFNNLIKNAIQAIKPHDKGEICIEIEDYDSQLWLVRVKDNGVGIADHLKERIFAPNFTTKSSGMGLGLAMVKNIIVGFGGTIWFESEAGKGAAFLFTLPKEER